MTQDLSSFIGSSFRDPLDGVRRLALATVGTYSTPGLPSPLVLVTCLGKFELIVSDVPVSDWHSSKAKTLFQYLINYHDRPVSKDQLIEALWPDPDAAAPATSLKVAVHWLRNAIGSKSKKPPLDIVAHSAGYSLLTTRLWLDVEEFEYCYSVGRAVEARGDHAEALALYARAASLYRGDFLEELTDEWPAFRRESLKDQYLFIATSLAQSAMESADYEEAISRSQQILAKDRCREDAYRMLIQCHAKLGQRGRVRSWYDLCVRTLASELDCQPTKETEDTYKQAIGGTL